MAEDYLAVAGLGSLTLALAGEANAEQTKHVAISGLHIYVGLNQGLPLQHKGPELVSCERHPPEVCEARMALNFLNAQAHLAV